MTSQPGGNVAGRDGSAGDPAVALYESEAGLIDTAAKQIHRSLNGLIELEELLSAGREGLFEAARRFEPEQGVPFRAFASYRVRGAMFDAVRKASWLPRRNQERMQALQAAGLVSEGAVAHVFVGLDSTARGNTPLSALDEHLASIATAAELAVETNASDSGALAQGTSPNPEQACAHHEMLALVRDAMAELNEQEALVIRLLFFEHRTLEETAAMLNVQKPWASRLQTRAIQRLTKRLRV